MADVWKIGQENTSEDLYAKIKNRPFIGNELIAVKILTNICNDMAKDFEKIVEDQNEYLFELEENTNNITELEQELKAKLQALEAEKNAILSKGAPDTLSDEDKQRLEEIDAEIETITKSTNSDIQTLETESDEAQDEVIGYDKKVSIATDYGETAIEKGEPLSKTKDKRKSFWRKIFGGWDQSAKREAGTAALEAGNRLLGDVADSKALYENITKKTGPKAT